MIDSGGAPAPPSASRETVRRGFESFISRAGADELIITSQILDHAARLESYEITERRSAIKSTVERKLDLLWLDAQHDVLEGRCRKKMTPTRNSRWS